MNPITYCMNVHCGEDLRAVRKALEEVTLPLKDALCLPGVMPVGLRLGVEAAKALRVPEQVRRFATFLQRNRLGVIGINGFPYGTFHDTEVKAEAYHPDWNSDSRVLYTRDLFYTLSHLPAAPLGDDHSLSVTTVPLGYERDGDITERMLHNLCDMALFLRKLEGFTGQRLCLALEPEPDCLLESTRTVIDFFERLWQFREWSPTYQDYIGLCFDTCHFAVGYEDPLNALRSIVSANIPVARIQVSAALEFTQYATEADFLPFLDSTYMHQTRRRELDASLTCFPDLTRDMLPEIVGSRGRIHYHVPLSWKGEGGLSSTRATLTPAFWRYVRAGGWPLELETYAFFVYPNYLRQKTLSESLLEDLLWIQDQLRAV